MTIVQLPVQQVGDFYLVVDCPVKKREVKVSQECLACGNLKAIRPGHIDCRDKERE